MKDIDYNRIESIVKEIEEIEFVYRIHRIDFNVTSKECKAEGGDYTDYDDLKIVGYKVFLTLPMKNSHAITLELHTTAYTKDQLEYVKNLLINLKECKK